MKGVEPLSPPDSSDDHSIGPLLAAAPTPLIGMQHFLASHTSERPTNPNCCYDVRNRLHGERIVVLRLVHRNTRVCWQLQHGRALALAQVRQQDDFSVGELKGIMMNV